MLRKNSVKAKLFVEIAVKFFAPICAPDYNARLLWGQFLFKMKNAYDHLFGVF
jgi:hypothetical protein